MTPICSDCGRAALYFCSACHHAFCGPKGCLERPPTDLHPCNPLPPSLTATNRQTVMHAHCLTHHNGGMWYAHFFKDARGTRACGSEPVLRVLVRDLRPGEESEYWAWWDAVDEEFMFVYPNRGLVEMCFAYGSAAEEKCGRGKLVNVVVEEQP